MSISEAQHAANKANAAHSTGPQTPTGKARSSKNRLTFGLFTISDFVREDESESYTKICTSLWSELSPAGTIEEAFTTEIMSATWRLRRCRMVEEDIAGIAILDPMQDPETAAQQKSVDRARAKSVNIMNRCINALRKLQTERGIRSQAFPETDVPARTRPDGHPPGRQNQTHGHRRGTRTHSGHRRPGRHTRRLRRPHGPGRQTTRPALPRLRHGRLHRRARRPRPTLFSEE
jgi:hypothetical protein